MAKTSETLKYYFFGGTNINGLEALGPKKYRDLIQYPEKRAEVLKRPVILALAAIKTVDAFAGLAFLVKASTLTFGPVIYSAMGVDPGFVPTAEIAPSLVYAVQHALVVAGSHYAQTLFQGEPAIAK